MFLDPRRCYRTAWGSVARASIDKRRPNMSERGSDILDS